MKGRPILYVFCLVENHKVLIPNSRYKEIEPAIVALLSNQEEDIYLKISIVEHLLPRLPNDSFIEVSSVIEYMANINPKNEDELELKRVSIGRMAHINRIMT